MDEALGIEFSEQDRAGIVTLNRLSRLNALNREMFDRLTSQYRAWAPNPHIYGVVMESTHPTVFCSGGDLKALHEWIEQGAFDTIRDFYRAAYSHCWELEKFVRPNVPLINGLLLGGGIGITLYGTHCVAGEGYKAAMPQVGIGFLPDIGGTYFLSRLENHFGLYLALTGRAIGPADAYRLHLITHYIPAGHFHVIKEAVSDNHPIDRLLDGLHRDPGEGEHARLTPAIQRIFGAPSVEEILNASIRSRARTRPGPRQPPQRFARSRRPRSKLPSPRCGAARRLTLAEALRLEFRLSSQIVASPDYREGITARITGKGAAPRWQPATLSEVDDAEVERLFATAPQHELQLAERQ